MANIHSKKLKIDTAWFNWILEKRERTLESLAADSPDGVDYDIRTIKDSVNSGFMSPRLLKAIAIKLNVNIEYLAGEYNAYQKLPIMSIEGVREYWDENYMHPDLFPYMQTEQQQIKLSDHLTQTLLLHGVTKDEFQQLKPDERREISRRVDNAVTRALVEKFPHCRHAEWVEYNSSIDWENKESLERDVTEALLPYLETRGIIQRDEDFYRRWNDDSDEFEPKYSHLPIVNIE